MLIDFREEVRRETEREKYQCEREISIGCLPCAPQQGIEQASWLCALAGNLPGKLLVYGAPTNCATLVRVYLLIIVLFLHRNNCKPIFTTPCRYFKILKYLDLRNILYLVKEKKKKASRDIKKNKIGDY